MRKPILLGFIAGFVSILVFHQAMIGVLNALGLVTVAPYRFTPVPPFGVPAILNSAFWGGVWGMVLAGVEPRFPRGRRYWVAAFVFGALAPTLVAWFVVAPLKGRPLGSLTPLRVVTVFLVNGTFGVGTALVLRLLSRRSGRYL
jgi:hypothetical protein